MIALNPEPAPVSVPNAPGKTPAPLDDGAASAAPRSRAALNLPGLCPLCGRDAVRKITHEGNATSESYRCPTDGEVSYRSGRHVSIGIDGRVADAARLVATRPGAAAHFVGMGSAGVAVGA